METAMRRTRNTAATTAFLLWTGMWAAAPVPAMGPNPGGKMGEDMPFEGKEVVRPGPAATAERQPAAPGDARPDCPAHAAAEGKEPAAQADCPASPSSGAKSAAPERRKQ